MTFATACAWSLLRSLIIAAVGLAIAVPLKETLKGISGRWAFGVWTLALLPVFVPGLLIGYGYRNFALSLVHHPVWNELLYAALVMLQVVPVGTLVLVCSPPPPVSASALHVRRLISSRRREGEALQPFFVVWARHHLFALLPAGVVMFLLAFQESEVATLMQVHSWTEWLFTRFVGGLQVAATLKVLVLPVSVQLVAIGAALWIAATSGGSWEPIQQEPVSRGVSRRWVAAGYLGVAVLLLAGVPGGVVLRGTWEGLSVLRAHRTLIGEVGLAVLMAITAGGLTWFVSGLVTRSGGAIDGSRRGRLVGGRVRSEADGPAIAGPGLPVGQTRPLLLGVLRRPLLGSGPSQWTIVVMLLPGLMGALALGLAVSGLVQREPLVFLRDSPVPLVLSEVAFLLPRAVLLRLLVGGWRATSSVHVARLLSGATDRRRRREASALLWRLDAGGRWGGLLLVCYWAYMELTLPSLLAPPGMTPAPVVLYNLMHYGQISGLSAMLFATMAAPVVLMVVGWWGFRAAPRLFRTF